MMRCFTFSSGVVGVGAGAGIRGTNTGGGIQFKHEILQVRSILHIIKRTFRLGITQVIGKIRIDFQRFLD